MNIRTIDLDGQILRVSIKPGVVSKETAPNTTPLLIMNGIGASLELLAPFVEAMHLAQPRLEIITFDVPGVGGSPTPRLPYRFSGLAKLVSRMLDYLDVGQVDVLGLSWGGFLSQQFAHDYPQRCRKLILAATCAGIISVPPSMKVLSIMSSPRRYIDSNYAASIAAVIFGGKFRTDKELVAKYAKSISQCRSEHPHSLLGYAYQAGAVYWWTSLPWLHKIKQPTLILAGDDDPLIPLCNMKILNKMIPNSEMYVFEKEGHLFLLTSLDEVVPMISEFLEGK